MNFSGLEHELPPLAFHQLTTSSPSTDWQTAEDVNWNQSYWGVSTLLRYGFLQGHHETYHTPCVNTARILPAADNLM